MLLTFSKDQFVYEVKSGRKIHTIRTDQNKRWREGMKIHFWKGNPRNPSKNPYPFGEEVCRGVQEITIERTQKLEGVIVHVDGRKLSEVEVDELCKNDGLSFREFRLWFVPPKSPVFKGRIIHWTEKKY